VDNLRTTGKSLGVNITPIIDSSTSRIFWSMSASIFNSRARRASLLIESSILKPSCLRRALFTFAMKSLLDGSSVSLGCCSVPSASATVAASEHMANLPQLCHLLVNLGE
jgi:hypothetical protein